MPRFLVSICDLNTEEHSIELVHAEDKASAALKHTWITSMYLPKWIDDNLADDSKQIETVAESFKDNMNWNLVCRNLDNLLMRDLNDGDSAVSLRRSTD